MGLVRSFLALAVAVAHLQSFDKLAQVGGSGAAIIAVKLFFVMSGFYMALVLTEKYSGTPKAFYMARALRLAPLYWATILATLAFFYLTSFATLEGVVKSRMWRALSPDWLPAQLTAMTVANLTTIGMDAGFLACYTYGTACLVLVNSMFVPQAWTLGIEVMFYIAAPFIMASGVRAVIGILVGSLSIKLLLLVLNAPDNWLRMFALAEMYYFMAGILAYFLYRSIERRLPRQIYLLPFVAVLISAVVLYSLAVGKVYYTPHRYLLEFVVEPALVVTFALLIPVVFHATREAKSFVGRWDKNIGDLSYPIYITHILSLWVSVYFLNNFISIQGGMEPLWLPYGVHLGCCACWLDLRG
jgi:peptidoglycan/LPS O-acetylase OafA/YrhL